ncbi:MAG: TonB-dependent receptor plug domain-containing protein [Muribaculaceae bacterium]|nr:TonB-dependent receptor plug domain-containing protein [Muribaculaceae bacterium]MDE6754539.1 TonB-dependent receptor plug domain-containing protein [Muribaculaceae bacterium]
MIRKSVLGVAIFFFFFALSQKAKGDELPDSIDTQTLKEIIVTGQSAHQRISSGKLGSENLELNKLALTPQLFGETDVIKAITLLPGVHGEADGAGGFEVRGGNAYQNLVMMDGMTLYNPAHMMGIFSTFNDDAMSRAILHKGPIPAQFGEASSSALETYMKPGDLNKYHFSGTIGILNAKISANGPIVKDKLSFSVAARRSYVDLFLKLIPQYKHTIMNFWDINARIHYKISSNNYLDGSFFVSRDDLAVSDLMTLHWGNLAGSVNWNYRTDNGWSFTTTGAVTDYTTLMGMDIMASNQEMTQYIHSFSLNERVLYAISDHHSIELGVRSDMLRVKSGDMYVDAAHYLDLRSGWSNAVWAGYEGDITKWMSLSAGGRLSLFSSLAASRFHDFISINEPLPEYANKTYANFEPRASLKFTINDFHNIKGGVSVTSQNIHGVRSTSTTFPFDRYALTSANVKPEQTIQYSAGYAGMTPDGGWDWSVEGYYKSMKNVYDYKDGMSMFSRVNLEDIILGGRGRSFGMELMLRKNAGKLNGWISYTLSKTETKIPGINNGKWYDASNDRRNDIAIVAIYDLNTKWKFSASWTYSSGRPLTAPDEKYEIAGTTCYYYSGRNTYKTPPSHRLDLSATYTRVGRKVTSIWAFGVYNAYSHQSPFVIYFEDDPSKPSGTRAVQQSLFGIIPSVSYTLKF